MKPAWDSLAKEYAGSAKVLIADVDCTGTGEPLCERFGVEGFPTIKYFNPPDDEGESYEGGRELADLQEFAKTLGPACSVSTKENCNAEQLAELETLLATPAADREEELAKLVGDLKTQEKEHDALLERLQAQYEKSNEALEAAKKAAAPRIKQLKMAGTKAPPPSKDDDKDDEPKEEL